MTAFEDPFDARRRLTPGCSCGHHASEADHAADPASADDRGRRVVENAVMRALFPLATATDVFAQGRSAVGAIARTFLMLRSLGYGRGLSKHAVGRRQMARVPAL